MPALKTKVLVVDDDASIRRLVHKYLTDQGLVVVHTDNASEALLLVRESRPDIILMDVEMPGLDGQAACRVIKKEASTQSIPVVIMSGARVADKDVLAGFAGGADDYVMKPFSLPVLLARRPRPSTRRPCARTASSSTPPGAR
jgi:DNA-binding response OmpR family regulator